MQQDMEPPRAPRARVFDCGQRIHLVPDQIVMAGLAGQLARNVGEAWYAVVAYSEGVCIGLGANDAVRHPPRHAVEWMAKTATTLNRDLNSMGHWVVAWSPADEPVLIWRDGDGDIHVAIEVAVKADRPETLEAHTPDRVLQIASDALAQAHAIRATLELRKDQTIKLARGERGSVGATRH